MTPSPSTLPSTTAPLHQHHADGTTQHLALTTDQPFEVRVFSGDGVERVAIPTVWLDLLPKLKPSDIRILFWLGRHADSSGRTYRELVPGKKSRELIRVFRKGHEQILNGFADLHLKKSAFSASLTRLEGLGVIADRHRIIRETDGSRRTLAWWQLYPNKHASSSDLDRSTTADEDAQGELFYRSTNADVHDEDLARAPMNVDSAHERGRSQTWTAPMNVGAHDQGLARAPTNVGARCSAPEVRGGGLGGGCVTGGGGVLKTPPPPSDPGRAARLAALEAAGIFDSDTDQPLTELADCPELKPEQIAAMHRTATERGHGPGVLRRQLRQLVANRRRKAERRVHAEANAKADVTNRLTQRQAELDRQASRDAQMRAELNALDPDTLADHIATELRVRPRLAEVVADLRDPLTHQKLLWFVYGRANGKPFTAPRLTSGVSTQTQDQPSTAGPVKRAPFGGTH
ncbi:MAG: hypothetical protein AAGI68_03620 [Planctomycetota bacterium]